MPRIRHVGGPVRYNHRALTGVSEPGDEHTVSDEAAEYLLNRRHFERVADEIVLDDDEYDVVDDADDELCGTEMSDGSTCERPADDCPYH